MKTITSFCIALLFISCASWSKSSDISAQNRAPAPPTDASDNDPGQGWPRKIESGGMTVLIYQPQVEKWQDNRLDSFAAVSVQSDQSQEPTYGVIYLTSRTEVDKVNRVVTLEDCQVTRANFPTDTDNAAKYLNIIEQSAPVQMRTIAFDRLEADLAIAQQAERHGPGYQLKNDPPRIILSTSPALLVLIDGQPVLRPAGQKDIERVINTRSLMLLDQKKSIYYLYVMDGWVQAPSPEGPWSLAKNPPGSLNKVKDQLAVSKQVDLLRGDESSQSDSGDPGTGGSSSKKRAESLKNMQKNGTLPTIYVSVVPAELLVTQGAPQLAPINGTRLLYVTNTSDHIFMDTSSQNYYVLISGRWFTSRSLDGQWQYVAGKELPPDFAKIPDGHAQADVLASIPGTPQAREALIYNDIPQTATITRSGTQLTVTYDGEPQFRPIEGTSLQYAVNARTPVIEVAANDYFAVDNGVWFVAGSPAGPWAVASSVPPVIYSIPPSSPLHYVTYVKIYDSTPDLVYCGYTPGYFGTVVSPEDVVVYGTGWYYPPYIGSYWIGWPWTYGFGAGFGWSSWGGWSFGLGLGFYYPFYRPWWGPLGWGWGWDRWRPGWGWNRWGGVAHVNAYGRWGRSAWVRTRSPWAETHGDIRGSRGDRFGNRDFRTGVRGPDRGSPGGHGLFGNRGPDNREIGRGDFAHGRQQRARGREDHGIYAGRDGNVYRHEQDGWQQHSQHGWKPAGRGADRGFLDGAERSRSIGGMRSGDFRSGGFGWGGFHGGFGGGHGGGGRH
jgi:hypothetical protein